MSCVRRHGPGWVAIGDAAGFVNPMNGEGIDYGLESGMLAVDLFLADPATAPGEYDRQVGERFDAFLRTGRRFSFLIGHPLAAAHRPAGRGRHPDRGQHHPGGDGQPRRQRRRPAPRGASCASPTGRSRVADPLLRRTRAHSVSCDRNLPITRIRSEVRHSVG